MQAPVENVFTNRNDKVARAAFWSKKSFGEKAFCVKMIVILAKRDELFSRGKAIISGL